MTQAAGASNGATLVGEADGAVEDEDMLEIKEVLEDYTKASEDEVR